MLPVPRWVRPGRKPSLTSLVRYRSAAGLHGNRSRWLGPQRLHADSTQVLSQVGTGESVPASSTVGIDPSPSVAYDLSADAFTGRLYLAYVDAPNPNSTATDILLRISNDSGMTWSDPITVNDDSSGNTHFAPHVAVDPVTGAVAVTWYDARNDNGLKQTGGGTDAIANNDVQVFGAVGIPVPGGVSFSSNFIVQPAFSNADDVISSAGLGAPPASLQELGTATSSVSTTASFILRGPTTPIAPPTTATDRWRSRTSMSAM